MLLFEGYHCWDGELLEGVWLEDAWESRLPLECPDRLGDGAELFALLTVPETLYLLPPPEEELEESPRALFWLLPELLTRPVRPAAPIGTLGVQPFNGNEGLTEREAENEE